MTEAGVLNPAVTFLRLPFRGTSDALVRAYANYLLRAADAYELPVPLGKVREHFSLPIESRTSLGERRGFTTDDLRIYLNADDLPTVRTFTLAHELVELLFFALRDGNADDWMDDDLFVALQENKERLCELGAAEIVMPMELFAPHVSREPLSLRWARSVARYCGVSLTATLWRILETGIVEALVLIWELKHKPREFVPSKVGQLNFFGPAEAMDPPKKMRIARVFRPPRLDEFIPMEKSVPESSVIHQALLTGMPAEGWEEMDLGRLHGRFFVEAAPFMGGEKRYVLSLVHLIPPAAGASVGSS